MYICDTKHAEIVYDQKDCPLCEANDAIYELKEEVSGLQDKIDNME